MKFQLFNDVLRSSKKCFVPEKIAISWIRFWNTVARWTLRNASQNWQPAGGYPRALLGRRQACASRDVAPEGLRSTRSLTPNCLPLVPALQERRERGSGPDAPGRVRTAPLRGKVETAILQDRRCSLTGLADTLRVSKETIRRTVHDLGYRKICCRWVPHTLNAEQKRKRVEVANGILADYHARGEDFLKEIVTVDETWVKLYDPLTRTESKQWKKKSEKAPVKPKIGPTNAKLMCTVFFDAEGIITVDFLEKGNTINSARYIASLRKLLRDVSRKRTEKRGKQFVLHQDNARPHTSRETGTFMERQGIRRLEHPPYSPDLAPADFFLFPKLKKMLRGHQFESVKEVRAAVHRALAQVSARGLMAAFTQWMRRLQLCVEMGGDYVEVHL